MRYRFIFCCLNILCLTTIAFTGCKKTNVQKTAIVPDLPIVTTTPASSVSISTAGGGGRIVADGGVTVSARGICWSLDSIPTIAGPHTADSTGIGYFNSMITGLMQGSVYFVRAYATTDQGTTYGTAISFSTEATDYDNNIYRTVIIGKQLWMVENLKVTHYRNGDIIPSIYDNNTWVSASTSYGAYSNYNNNDAIAQVYGRLYNYPSLTDKRNICPTGWHLPTDAEWQKLVIFLGGNEVAGGAMKESGVVHWQAPNTGATNSSGFTGLPAGNVGYGGFYSLGSTGGFWSDPSSIYGRTLLFDHNDIAGSGSMPSVLGLSIRCIKD